MLEKSIVAIKKGDGWEGLHFEDASGGAPPRLGRELWVMLSREKDLKQWAFNTLLHDIFDKVLHPKKKFDPTVMYRHINDKNASPVVYGWVYVVDIEKREVVILKSEFAMPVKEPVSFKFNKYAIIPIDKRLTDHAWNMEAVEGYGLGKEARNAFQI